MPRDTVKYYYGRLNIIGVYENKYNFVKEGLGSDIVISRYRHNWGFFDISSLEDSRNGSFLTGFLVKYREEDTEERVNEISHTLDDENVEDRVKAKSRFFLHVQSGLIAFHPVGGHISREIFRHRFCELFEEAFERMFIEASIVYIEERGKFFELLKTLDQIRRISVWLHPSNPSNYKKWEKIDQRLKTLDAKDYREIYNTSGTLRADTVEDDEEIEGKVLMAEDGYGLVDANGIKDGRNKTVSTKDNPLTAESYNDSYEKNKIYSKLIATFEEIFERFDKKNPPEGTVV